MAELASQKVTEFDWSPAKTEAALLVAEDRLTDEDIAAKVGVTRRSLARWKLHPEFRDRVTRLVEAMDDSIARKGIARRAKRVEALDRRWVRMQAVIDARGADPAMAAVPGGATGLLVRSYRQVGDRTVEEYEVDTALLKELREHEKQAAQELGQWSDKHEHSHSGSVSADLTIEFEYERLRKLPYDELLRLHRQTLSLPQMGSN